MKKNKKWLSLVVAISMALLMWLLAIYILEYMIPFSKNTKGIENSVWAYYLADSAIEDALYSMSWQTLGYEKTDSLSGNRDYSIAMSANWNTLPPSGEWNSEFDKDYNILRLWDPIQIEVWSGAITSSSNFKIYIKVPDLNSASEQDETLSWASLKIANWQLSSSSDVLNASGSQITATEINNDWSSWISLWNKVWSNLANDSKTFSNFYWSECNGSWEVCKLKISVINKLELTNGTNVPYLEWKIVNGSSIPLRYTIIDTIWRSYGFRKILKVKVPQQTVNEAFDFTVFQ